MKRDLDLVRRILLNIEQRGEDSQSPSGWSAVLEEGYAIEAVQYHVQLLHDAGLIEADELVPGQWWPERMTWAGHEFLDAARNQELWNRVKQKIERRVGSAPFRVVHELLIELTHELLEESGED